MGWPAGTLLIMRGNPEYFSLRPFDGIRHLAPQVKYVILDGQQRLTSLFRALHNVGPFVYAIKFGEVSADDIDSLEENIVSYRRADWESSFPSETIQRDQGLVPVYALKSASDFFAWKEAAARGSKKKEKSPDPLSVLYKALFSRVDGYEFPAVIMERELQPDAIARIFERINKTGMRLGAFDLMVARSYGPKWNLRQKWAQASDEHVKLHAFLEDDGMPVLQCIALTQLNNIRQSAILALDVDTVRKKWQTSAKAIESAASFLMAECGVLNQEWLPYRAQLLVLAGLVATGVDLSKNADLWRSWFWDRSFNQGYDVASNTRTVSDFKYLLEIVAGDMDFEFRMPNLKALQEATKRGQGALWRSFVCALASNKPIDLSGDSLEINTKTKPKENGTAIEIQPIFGKETTPDGPGLHTRILSSVLLLPETASHLKRATLSKLVDTLVRQSGSKAADSILATQFLPPAKDIKRLEKNPSAILEYRSQSLAKFLLKFNT